MQTNIKITKEWIERLRAYKKAVTDCNETPENIGRLNGAVSALLGYLDSLETLLPENND